MYLSFEEYESYGGNLTEEAFNDLEMQAEMIVNYVSFNRLKKDSSVSEQVKRCMYQLIKLLILKIQSLSLGVDAQTGSVSGTIASQSNDGYSTSFNVLSANQAYELSKHELNTTARTYLAEVTNELGQKILYRGYYPNE